MNRRLLQGLALCGLLSVASAHAAVATYNITTTWYEPATSPRDSIFIGTFDYDDVTHEVTNLKGILSESMSGARIAYDASAGPGQYDNMTWLGLDNVSNRVWGATQSFMGTTYTEAEILALHQKYELERGLDNQLLPSWHDATLGGTFAITFRNDNTNTFTTSFGGDGWSPQAGVDVGGIYYGWPGKASLNPGNAYALIFVPDTLSIANGASNPLTLSWHEGQVDQATGEVIEASTGDLGLAHTAYADCVPTVNPIGDYAFGGGMMQAVCMTGTSWDAYGARGTMGGVPFSQRISLASVPTPNPSFTDVAPDFWAVSEIEAIAAAGITHGCGEGKFCPADYVTREQVAALIVRAREGEPTSECTTPPFNDVATTSPFCKYIERLSALSVTTGCGNGNFCPQQTVTREQVAALIIRALEGDPQADYCGDGVPFDDVSSSSNFCGHVKRMKERNITTGCGAGNYCPTQPLVRDQMAVVFSRAFLRK